MSQRLISKITLSPHFTIRPPEGKPGWAIDMFINNRSVLGRCECGGHYVMFLRSYDATVIRCADENCRFWVCYPGKIATIQDLVEAAEQKCIRREIWDELNRLSLDEARCLVDYLKAVAVKRDLCPS